MHSSATIKQAMAAQCQSLAAWLRQAAPDTQHDTDSGVADEAADDDHGAQVDARRASHAAASTSKAHEAEDEDLSAAISDQMRQLQHARNLEQSKLDEVFHLEQQLSLTKGSAQVRAHCHDLPVV